MEKSRYYRSLGSENNMEQQEQQKPEKSLHTKLKDIIFFILRIALAVGLIYWIIHKNQDSLVKAIKGFDPVWLIPVAVLYIIQLIGGAWKWQVLLHVQDVKITFFESLSLSMQGFFFSLFLPGGTLGGDVVKAAFISKRAGKGRRLNGAFTILIDRILGMIALFSLAGVTALLSYKFLSNVTGAMTVILASLIVGCVLGLASAIVLFFHRTLEKIPLIKWGLNLGDRLTKGTFHRLMEAMDSFRSAWPSLIKNVLISLCMIHLTLALMAFCIAKGLHTPPVASQIYIIGTTLPNAAGTLPITPAGTGTRDFVMINVFGSAFMQSQPNLAKEDAMGMGTAIALIFTAVVLLFNVLGGLFFIMDKFIAKKALPPPEQES